MKKRAEIESDYRRNLEEFINKIRIEDVDIENKLDNLCASGLISDKLYEKLADNEEEKQRIAKEVIERIKSKESSAEILAERMEEFAKWHDEEELEKMDYTDALYNCDEFYMSAIGTQRATDSEVSDEEEYEI